MSGSPVQFTGERFLPECGGEIWAEHWHRYLFARQLVAGKSVLDAASGEGYGSAWLAHSAASVVGLDIHRPTVEAARLRYRASNLTFEVGSVTAMPFADASFDCVVSFETLEHLEGQEQMLAEIRRVLRPHGFVLISTPNRSEYTERREFHNEFHVLELDQEEFRALLDKRFPAQRWFGQKLLFNSAVWPLLPATTEAIEWIALEDRSASMPEPMYFIACAASSEDCIPRVSRLTLLADPAEEMYREYEQTVVRVDALEKVARQREKIVFERDAQLAQLAERSGRLEKLALERAAVVEERDRQLAAQSLRAQRMEALIVERESVIARRDEEAAAREHALGERDRLIVERDRQLEEVNARASELERLLLDRERLIAERDDQLGATNERVASVEALVAARDKLLADTNARIEMAEKLLAHREAIVVERDAQLAAAHERLAFAEGLVAERDAAITALVARAAGLNERAERLESRVAGFEHERKRLLVEISRRAGVHWWMTLPYLRLRALSDPSVLDPKADEA
jgi:SAM-dependent methyltransferase